MTLQEAKARVLAGQYIGTVYPKLAGDKDKDELRAWFVIDSRLPAIDRRTKTETTGNACRKCGGANLIRTGTCVTCQDCGDNEGCG
jgi:hypothetical protein